MPAKTVFEVKNRGQFVGLYDSVAQSFIRKVSVTRNLIRKYGAWAIESAVHKALVKKGCKWWVVHETENNTIGHLAMDKVPVLGKLDDLGGGHGQQYFVPLVVFVAGMPPKPEDEQPASGPC